MSDKTEILLEILRIQGNEEGVFFRNRIAQEAAIPRQKRIISELEESFKSYCKQRVNVGFKQLKNWPIELLNKKLEAESKLQNLSLELKQLNKKLKEISEAEQEEEDKMILYWGLRGICKTKAGIASVVDGMQIIKNNDDRLIISNGPYRGMELCDYRDLCEFWIKEQKKREEEKLREAQEIAKSNNEVVPIHLGVQSMRKANPNSFPGWPAGVKNWLK